jgi:hypothetical protein
MSAFTIVPPSDIQPGDIQKFTPSAGVPVYRKVVEVKGDYVAIEMPYKGVPTIMYTARSGPQVTYGRRNDNT